MKKYDICVYFDADYLCTGSFYDSFEYWWLLRKKYGEVGFIIMTPAGVTQLDIFRAIHDKYDVSNQIQHCLGDIHFFAREYYQNSNQVVPIIADLLVVPSMSAAAQMFYYDVLLSYQRMITMWELPEDHMYMRAFDEKRKNVTMLYDPRVFKGRKDYDHIPYYRALYFDIMKKMIKPARDSCLLNMVTDHKCYEPDRLYEIMEEWDGIEHWTIVTKDKWASKYMPMMDKNYQSIDVLLSPVRDYMYKFNSMMYLPSVRKLDPSPRLMPECRYFGKQVNYYQVEDAGKVWKKPN
jgi:hypothetical protein